MERTRSVAPWLTLALIPNVAAQIARLYQTNPLDWLICDYAGRLGVLAVLAAIPASRNVAFARQPLRISWWETTAWILLLVIGYPFFSQSISSHVNSWLEIAPLGHYPWPKGWLEIFDLTAGVALVSYHEEIVFRRCGREVFRPYVGDGLAMVFLSALIFAVYHWTTGPGNMTSAFFFGLYMMFFLKRSGALWPAVLAHYLVDLEYFSGWTKH